VSTPNGAPPRVFLLGDLNIDLVFELSEPLRSGGDGLATSHRVSVGGSATNTAVILRRLGFDAVLLAATGADPWAEQIHASLRAERIDLTHVVELPEQPTFLNVVAVTPDGERTMLGHRGASVEYRAADLPEEAIATCALLHVSGYALMDKPQSTAAERAVEVARAAGVPVSLDVPVDPARHRPSVFRDALAWTDLLSIGVPEAVELVGQREPRAACAELHRLGASTVALKRGVEGTVMSRGGDWSEVPGLPVPTVDTTGAGDAFAAGAIAATIAGLPLARIGAMANLFGAAAVGTLGAGRSLPTLRQVQALARDLGGHDVGGHALDGLADLLA